MKIITYTKNQKKISFIPGHQNRPTPTLAEIIIEHAGYESHLIIEETPQGDGYTIKAKGIQAPIMDTYIPDDIGEYWEPTQESKRKASKQRELIQRQATETQGDTPARYILEPMADNETPGFFIKTDQGALVYESIFPDHASEGDLFMNLDYSQSKTIIKHQLPDEMRSQVIEHAGNTLLLQVEMQEGYYIPTIKAIEPQTIKETAPA